MTRLLLIRHGINDCQKNGIVAGWMPDVHLNQEGRAQAEALAQRLSRLKIEALYSSPLERALETAEIIAAPHGLPVTVHEKLGEVIFGRWTGESLEQLRRRSLWRAVQFVPSEVRFPGGEGLYDMQTRIVAELESLRAKHPRETVVVVSHGDVIKAAVAHYAGLHLDMFQRLMVSPASVTALELGEPAPRVLCLNDTGHLPPPVEGEGI